jgi:hypothetical protein
MKKDKSKSQLSCLAVENIEYYENITNQNLSLKMKNIRIGKADNNTKTLNTMQTLSSLFGVSERYIADAKKLYKLDVELFNKVRTGTITLSKAFSIYYYNENNIYIIGCSENQFIKIGFTNNLEKRLMQINCSSPYNNQIIKSINGDYKLEKQIHKKFNKYLYNKEWFYKSILDDLEFKKYFFL